MRRGSWRRRVVLTTAAVLGTAVLGMAPAAHASTGPVRAAAVTEDAQTRAYLRAWYYNYYDCDLAAFSGVYYGHWRGYICQWHSGYRLWGLYA